MVPAGVVVFDERADLFFELRAAHPNLIGFKEFGGAADLSYAGQNITSASDDLTLMVGVDTQVYHGFVNCGATGAITGIGNALPKEVLHLIKLSKEAAAALAAAAVRLGPRPPRAATRRTGSRNSSALAAGPRSAANHAVANVTAATASSAMA